MQKKPPIIADYHIHTPYCGHAHGSMIDYVEHAVETGIREMCFTDHLGRYYLTKSQKTRYKDWGMGDRRLSRYQEELEDLQVSYKDRITIKIGLEVDYIEGAEELVQPYIDAYPYDFVLGSVHCLPAVGWKHLATYAPSDSWPLYNEYFSAVAGLLASGLFDALAHIDFIWRYIKWPVRKTKQIANLIQQSIRAASDSGVAIEINSNGYLWSQIYNVAGGDPFETMLENIKTFNAPITIGSDAHKPVFVGKSFPEVARLLKGMGITRYYTFSGHKRVEQHIQ